MSTDTVTPPEPPLSKYAFDPSAPLVASGNLRRRQIVNRIAEGAAMLAAALAIGVLFIIVETVVVKGGHAISWTFISKDPAPVGLGGGIRSALVGTGVIVAVATMIAAPIGILLAVYMTEFASKTSRNIVRLVLDLMNGLPSIVVGLFVFGALVAHKHQSGFAAAFALAIIMVPLIARSTQEMLQLVPAHLREGTEALGVAKWRAVLTVIIPSVLGGIVTGTVLAIARAAGETAPLILVDSIYSQNTSFGLFGHAIPNIPVTIFELSEAADPTGFEKAWGAALLLLAFILLTNIAARTILARSRKKLGA